MIHVLRAPRTVCETLCNDERLQHFAGPVGGFLALALALNVPAACCALSGCFDPVAVHCRFGPLSTLCEIDVIISVAHIAFPLHVKRQLLEMEKALDQAPGARQEPRFRRIRDGVRRLVLYDVGTAVYILVFVFSIVFNIIGSTWVQPCMLTSGAIPAALSLELTFAALAVLYVAFSVCYVNCIDCCEGLQTSRSVSDVQHLARSFKPLNKLIEALCGSNTRSNTGPVVSQTPMPGAPYQVLAGAPSVPSAPAAFVTSMPPAGEPSAPVIPPAPSSKQALAGLA